MQKISGFPFENWLLDRIVAAKSIVLMTHVGPDADGLGSQLAFCRAAELKGIQVRIVNEDPLPPRYRWLDPQGLCGHFDRDAAILESADLALIFDANELQRIGRPAQRLKARGVDVWVVDHHPVAPTLDVQGCVDIDFSSSGELVFQLITALGWPIDAGVAQGLYAAMSFDTGSFRFLRNQSRTLRVAAQLLDTGLDANPIAEALFSSRPRGEIELLGRVLQQLQFADGGRLAWVACDSSLTEGLDVANDAIGELIATLIGIEGVLVAMMIKPGRQPGEHKLSLRSKTAVKIGHVVRPLGGGGHDHAAGATLTGELAEQTRILVAQLVQEIRRQQPEAAGQV